jgi:Gram-negative porin
MDMFGGLTKTSSRIAIASALGMTLGGFVMSSHPAKAADLGGDCCADLEERVAELEATTVRKGNKKVSVTLSGWVVKYGAWWDDGVETNFYVGDKHTTLSSHMQISGSATIAPGWSGGYTLSLEMRGGNAVGDDNQFNDNSTQGLGFAGINLFDNQSVLLSYMWLKSDRWGTVNWGQLSQATDNVALLPDLSGTIIESNAVLFDGSFFLLRPKGFPQNAEGLSSITWGNVTNCLEAGGGLGADCNGYPQNGIRYDTPTWYGFSFSGGYYEDDVWDAAVKYATDFNWWGGFKFSAAYGFTENTDEGCFAAGSSSVPAACAAVFTGGGGAPFQGFRRDVTLNQVGASILHVPTGLFAYGLYQHEDNDGTSLSFSVLDTNGHVINVDDQNSTDVWYVKAGIRRTWTPLGATVLFGEGGQYEHQFAGLSGANLCDGTPLVNNLGGGSLNPNLGSGINGGVCLNNPLVFMTDSTVNRWGAGVVQEIDSAAMHLWFNWQHLELDADFIGNGHPTTEGSFRKVGQGFEDLDLFMAGGVIFF